MKGHAKIELLSISDNNMMSVKVHHTQKKSIIDVVKKCSKDTETLLDIIITGRACMTSALNGIITIRFKEDPLFRMDTVGNRRSKNQHTTLRGIERFIFIAESGYKPTQDDLYWIHEGLLEKYSPWVTNPRTGVSIPKRTSDPSMTTVEMAKIVQGALNELSTMEVPDEILNEIGHNMKKLWENWYRWRYEQETDPLFYAENSLSWEKYKSLHPVCEFCGMPDNDFDPLIQMHIISKGSDTSIREMPWNWIRSHNSHHMLQHNEGWEIIERSYPHMVGKLKRARLMQGRENL